MCRGGIGPGDYQKSLSLNSGQVFVHCPINLSINCYRLLVAGISKTTERSVIRESRDVDGRTEAQLEDVLWTRDVTADVTRSVMPLAMQAL